MQTLLRNTLLSWFVLALVSADPAWAEKFRFTREVVPALTKAGCNSGACHGSFQGRGGMSLSLLGFNPAADYDVLFKQGRGRRVNPAAPELSLLLLKGTAQVPHGGGKRLAADSDAYRVLRDYIAAGLPPLGEHEPTVVRLDVTPREVTLAPQAEVKLKVTAHWSDGFVQDATPWALYDSRFKARVEVDEQGVIRALEPGKSPVTVRYLGQVAAVAVSVPYAESVAAAPFTPHNKLDEIIAAEWQRLRLTPAPLCDDATYVRRLYLDLIGTLPQPAEVLAFLNDDHPQKRTRLVDELLARPEYVDFWTLRWSDLLRVHRRYLGEKGLAAFSGWLRRAMRENLPIDRLTRDVLTSQGSLYGNGPVAFYFIDSKPEELAETTAQVFMGVRLQCTRCHHHPLEVWSQDDYYGLAACFTRVEIKNNGDNGRFGGAQLLRTVAQPNKKRAPLVAADPSVLGRKLDLSQTDDVRRDLAAAITAPDNPFFARSFANRYWAWLTGRGLIEPVDDLRATNPPTIPAALDWLTQEFVAHGYDARHLIRTICASRVYQLASEVNPVHDADGSLYTHRVPRRLIAEVLLDAINQVTQYNDTSFDGTPKGTRAIALPDPSIKSYFLDAFGRPVRNSACECARQGGADLAQALHLVNGSTIQERITGDGSVVSRLLNEKLTDAAIVDQLYLATFARRATTDEQRTIQELLRDYASRQEAFEDVLWSLLNAAEFSFNH